LAPVSHLYVNHVTQLRRCLDTDGERRNVRQVVGSGINSMVTQLLGCDTLMLHAV